MKRIIYILLLAVVCGQAWAQALHDETLHYRVMYKWGLVNKKAGTVTISMDTSDPHLYRGTLTAASAPWADKLYKVRDTLRCEIAKQGFLPMVYEKMSHEGGVDKRDVVRYSRQGATVIGECTRLESKDGKVRKDEQRTLEAIGTTVDMFSAYYLMRSLPFEEWTPGHVLSMNIFSGKRKELLTIKYHGVEEVEIDKAKHRCYMITFIFTGEDQKKTSDDMMAWITADDKRVPVKLEGKLPVGSVKCFLER